MGLTAMLRRSTSKKERTQDASPVSPSSGGQDQGHSRSHFPIPTPPSPPSTDLRGRNPGDGISSLQAVQQHDHATLGVPASAATAFTAGPSMVKTPIGNRDGSDVPSTVVHINPLDDNINPTPFAFKPYALAALVHPKTLKDLDTMGGLEGLCAGLGTNPTKGLSAHSLGQGTRDGEKLVVKVPLPPRLPIVNEFTAPTRC